MAIGDTMDTLIMDSAMDTGEEKGDLLNLNQSPKLSLTQTHATDTHIVDTTGVNKDQRKTNIK